MTLKINCVFCDQECEPSPTNQGWSYVGPGLVSGRGLHFHCARKVAAMGEAITRAEGKIPPTHDTVVVGGVDNIITFFKSYHYATQEEEAQRDFKYVLNDKNAFHFWYLGTIEHWKLIRWPPEGQENTYDIKGEHKSA